MLNGLLNNSDLLMHMGLGLMSASAPSLQPVNPARGLLQGMQSYQASQSSQLQNRLLEQKMAQEQAGAERAKQLQAATQKAAGLLSTPETIGLPIEQRRQMAGNELLGAGHPGAMKGLLGQLFPEPKAPLSSMGKLVDDYKSGRISQQQFDQGLAVMNKPLVAMGDKGPEYVPLNQLQNFVDPVGKNPAPGTTMEELRSGRYKSTTSAKEQQAGKVTAAMGILDEIERMAVGEDGLFQNFKSGFQNRLGSGWDSWVQQASQEDPRFSEYSGIVSGTLAPLIKALGESGNLATEDVARAANAIPKLPGMPGVMLPDTYETAKRKLKVLRDILSKVSPDALERARAAMVPPPPGFIEDK